MTHHASIVLMIRFNHQQCTSHQKSWCPVLETALSETSLLEASADAAIMHKPFNRASYLVVASDIQESSHLCVVLHAVGVGQHALAANDEATGV
jgi:hypothetical protein